MLTKRTRQNTSISWLTSSSISTVRNSSNTSNKVSIKWQPKTLSRYLSQRNLNCSSVGQKCQISKNLRQRLSMSMAILKIAQSSSGSGRSFTVNLLICRENSFYSSPLVATAHQSVVSQTSCSILADKDLIQIASLQRIHASTTFSCLTTTRRTSSGQSSSAQSKTQRALDCFEAACISLIVY